MIDLDRTVEIFADSRDLTVGVEEEFAILDPVTLELAPRFDELRDAATATDPVLGQHITGELISSEIEIISGRGNDLRDALARQRERRRGLFALSGSR
ncbi:MAG TPA: glutamate--cysteine ligase, partial [Solirubrobacteraceae bacterium]|nr:glutamate--cysteine ligase [Solirubrobacteraceae bacterium]